MKRKKILKLIVGTNNLGKLREIKHLLPKKIKVFSPKNFGIKSPKENGKTFKENSLIKAKFFSKKTGMICLADDSGLEIDILNKRPGIFSSRWAGKKGNFNFAIQKVFKKLNRKDSKWKRKKIKARFVCALSIYWPNGKKIIRNGKIEGFISNKKKGKNGFGYDPIFIPYGKIITFSQMSPKLKFKIDHRAKAFNKIKKFF
jgi:XTP/dITP diphosphohydrolase|tara:strand:+ start:1096 stop:1698 length:603 start_codon:yes stop_codon:yes gene_type:complete